MTNRLGNIKENTWTRAPASKGMEESWSSGRGIISKHYNISVCQIVSRNKFLVWQCVPRNC